MSIVTANRFSRFVLVCLILGLIKVHVGSITYFELFKATPAAYTVVEKLCVRQSTKRRRRKRRRDTR